MDKLWKKYPLFLDSFLAETSEYRQAYDSLKDRRLALEHLKKNKAFVDSTKKWRTRLEAGFVAIEPSTGHILAWIGGSDYSKFQYDHVYMARRQAGSTFKPFVYTVAIDNGMMPYTRISKYPTRFYDRSGRVWAPSDEHIPEGDAEVTLRTALAKSMNNVTVRLLPELAGKPGTNKLEDLFPAANKIVQMAYNLGIKSKLEPYPSIALGTAEVTLLELVSAYTTFANKGVHIEPFAITRIEDKNGNVLAEFKSESQREAISQETAYIMVDMLRGTIRGVDGGSGTGVRLRYEFGVTQDIAGKTGTTQNSADNWFIAFTPAIAMGAWVGGEDRRIRFPEDTWIGQGARTSLPIVGEFIRRARADKSVNWSYEAFEQPEGFIMPEPPTQKTDPQKNQKLGRTGW
jgi:penicillin-binding protein 1A